MPLEMHNNKHRILMIDNSPSLAYIGDSLKRVRFVGEKENLPIFKIDPNEEEYVTGDLELFTYQSDYYLRNSKNGLEASLNANVKIFTSIDEIIEEVSKGNEDVVLFSTDIGEIIDTNKVRDMAKNIITLTPDLSTAEILFNYIMAYNSLHQENPTRMVLVTPFPKKYLDKHSDPPDLVSKLYPNWVQSAETNPDFKKYGRVISKHYEVDDLVGIINELFNITRQEKQGLILCVIGPHYTGKSAIVGHIIGREIRRDGEIYRLSPIKKVKYGAEKRMEERCEIAIYDISKEQLERMKRNGEFLFTYDYSSEGKEREYGIIKSYLEELLTQNQPHKNIPIIITNISGHTALSEAIKKESISTETRTYLITSPLENIQNRSENRTDESTTQKQSRLLLSPKEIEHYSEYVGECSAVFINKNPPVDKNIYGKRSEELTTINNIGDRILSAIRADVTADIFTHQKYINHLVEKLFGYSYEALAKYVAKQHHLELKFDHSLVEEYATSIGRSTDFIEETLPHYVNGVLIAYGRVIILLDRGKKSQDPGEKIHTQNLLIRSLDLAQYKNPIIYNAYCSFYGICMATKPKEGIVEIDDIATWGFRDNIYRPEISAIPTQLVISSLNMYGTDNVNVRTLNESEISHYANIYSERLKEIRHTLT